MVKAKLRAIDRAGSALFASGRRDLLRSTDRGKTWTPLHKPGRASQVDFLDARTGYFLAEGGALWGTSNAGKKWSKLLGVGTERVLGVAFSSKTRGYLVVDSFGDTGQRSGFLLRTNDGGATWQALVQERAHLTDENFFDAAAA